MLHIDKDIKKNLVDANKMIYRLICKAAVCGLRNDEIDTLKANSQYVKNEIYRFES